MIRVSSKTHIGSRITWLTQPEILVTWDFPGCVAAVGITSCRVAPLGTHLSAAHIPPIAPRLLPVDVKAEPTDDGPLPLTKLAADALASRIAQLDVSALEQVGASLSEYPRDIVEPMFT